MVDVSLVRRVEQSGARFTLMPAAALPGARAVELDGGALVALGPGRYVNRAVGVGFGGTPAAGLLDAVESFFAAAGLPPSLEVSPWAGEALVTELARRGYTVTWFRDVYARELTDLPPYDDVFIDVVDDLLEPAWTAILGEQAEPGSPARAISDEFCAAIHRRHGGVDLVAVLDGRPVATGSITVVDGVGWFGGAATLADQRGRGAQHALLIDRLHRAQRAGCTLAAVTALVGGTSGRNLLRVGFQLLYTQAVMTRTG